VQLSIVHVKSEHNQDLQHLSWCNRQKVLVMGGGGAVGLSAIQLARSAECYVACTCGKQSMERVKEAGAEEAIDYTTPVT
jgi:NADPH:quinone reductase-like Zn-dependent oxidoreductase